MELLQKISFLFNILCSSFYPVAYFVVVIKQNLNVPMTPRQNNIKEKQRFNFR